MEGSAAELMDLVESVLACMLYYSRFVAIAWSV